MSALSDLLNSQPMTARQAAEKAAADGIDLRLAGYWAGNHGRPTRRTLEKLAQVVPQLSETQLQEAAWGIPAPLGPYQPTEESVHLTELQRRALDGLIKSIVGPQGATHVDHSRVPADSSASSGAPAETRQDKEGGGSPDHTESGATLDALSGAGIAELQVDGVDDDGQQAR